MATARAMESATATEMAMAMAMATATVRATITKEGLPLHVAAMCIVKAKASILILPKFKPQMWYFRLLMILN